MRIHIESVPVDFKEANALVERISDTNQNSKKTWQSL
jgi:hypothetical protein